jgi:uroporphyrinogen decarboxylase
VRFVEGEGPVVDAVRSADALDRLRPDAVPGRLEAVYEAVRGVRAALSPTTALIGFAGGPWTLACYMIEGRANPACLGARRLAYAADGMLERLIALLTEAVAAHLLAQIEAGCGVVQLFDSWAGTLAEEPFRRLVIAPTRTIVERLRAARPEVPIIAFPRGAGVLYRDFVRETGVDAVSIDAGVPLVWAAEVLQPRVAVQGNLDNALLAEGGPVLIPAVERILARLGGGRLVFNLGHGVLPETPPDHVAAVVAAVAAFRRG